MAINSTTDDGGEDAYGEWEGGPLEMGAIKRDAAPDNTDRLDEEISQLEANEPQPGDNTPPIDDPGISPIPEVPGQELLGGELSDLEKDEGFDFESSASTPEAVDVGAADTEEYTPPESLGELLKSLPSGSIEEEKKEPTARQKRGQSRVGNPPAGEKDEGLGSMDEGGASSTLQDADIRNRDTVAKQSIDHMRRIEEITERLLAART